MEKMIDVGLGIQIRVLRTPYATSLIVCNQIHKEEVWYFGDENKRKLVRLKK